MCLVWHQLFEALVELSLLVLPPDSYQCCRYFMEQMIPELEDLEERGFFTKAEIKRIVKKREQFEYLLKRPAPVKGDFYR